MSTSQTDSIQLQTQITDLQSRLEFQDAVIDTLNGEVTIQQQQVTALTQRIDLLESQLKAMATRGQAADPGTEPPPPHY